MQTDTIMFQVSMTITYLKHAAPRLASEHLQMQAESIDCWLSRSTSYDSPFPGAGATVSFGDKASGSNPVLPGSGAARVRTSAIVHL